MDRVKRLSVRIDGNKKVVVIEDSGNKILLRVEDISWLREVLDDIKNIVKMDKVEPKTTSNDMP